MHLPFRRLDRRTTARTWRALSRSTFRSLCGGRRTPNYLSQALTAYSRAIRCQHRLAKLAPSFFDSTVVDREARERDERRRWIASWEPLLDKVYGPSHDPNQQPRQTQDDLPPLPGRRTQRAVEREWAGLHFWIARGDLALDRYKRRRRHLLPNLSQLTRLFRISFDFAQLACGLPKDPEKPDPDVPSGYLTAEAALNRIYGEHNPANTTAEGSDCAPESLNYELSTPPESFNPQI